MAQAILARGAKASGFVLALTLALSGCEEGEFPKLGLKKPEPASSASQTSTKLVERDVEAPDIFQVTETALWDGRPSLGGVWVAYPGQTNPERVIIRNEANNKFVIGALFKRERDNPGPRIQMSSDAAAALGILAGQPTVVNVTALRREQVPDETVVQAADASEDIAEQKLGPIAAAAAAIDEADAAAQVKPEARPTADTTVAMTAPKISTLAKPFIQIGIFSIEKNATNTAASLRTIGIVPIIKAQESRGKKFWRVLAGPATNSAERAVLLKKIKGLGFSDAYFVTN